MHDHEHKNFFELTHQEQYNHMCSAMEQDNSEFNKLLNELNRNDLATIFELIKKPSPSNQISPILSALNKYTGTYIECVTTDPVKLNIKSLFTKYIEWYNTQGLDPQDVINSFIGATQNMEAQQETLANIYFDGALFSFDPCLYHPTAQQVYTALFPKQIQLNHVKYSPQDTGLNRRKASAKFFLSIFLEIGKSINTLGNDGLTAQLSSAMDRELKYIECLLNRTRWLINDNRYDQHPIHQFTEAQQKLIIAALLRFDPRTDYLLQKLIQLLPKNLIAEVARKHPYGCDLNHTYFSKNTKTDWVKVVWQLLSAKAVAFFVLKTSSILVSSTAIVGSLCILYCIDNLQHQHTNFRFILSFITSFILMNYVASRTSVTAALGLFGGICSFAKSFDLINFEHKDDFSFIYNSGKNHAPVNGENPYCQYPQN